MEAELLEPEPETTSLYVERTKCVEGVVEEGKPPVFIVQLQSVCHNYIIFIFNSPILAEVEHDK